MNRTRRSQVLALAIVLALGCTAPAVGQQAATQGSAGQPDQQQALFDRMLIRELQDRYAIVHDFGTPEEYASVFSDDGAIAAPTGQTLVQGRAALIAYAERNRERWSDEPGADGRISSFMRHLISNSEIEVTGPDTATGMSYVTTLVQRGEIGPAILSIGRYEDRYVRQNGQWLIAHRTIIMDLGDSELAQVLGLRN
jgi:hypothetical protein